MGVLESSDKQTKELLQWPASLEKRVNQDLWKPAESTEAAKDGSSFQ
jgi:hypothetical protein